MNEQTTTVAEKHDRTLELIKQYLENKIGIKLTQQNDLNTYLNLTPTDIRKMSAAECGEASYILAASALYIQIESNKVSADIGWCESALSHIIAKHIEQFAGDKFLKFEQKRAIIINNNEAATQLNNIIVAAKIRYDTLQFLPAQIKLVIGALNNIQQAKRGANG